MHSAKGLEFAHVFIGGLQALPMKEESLEDALRLLYVAMTRATGQLVLAASGASLVVERVRSSLDKVAAQFATGGEAPSATPATPATAAAATRMRTEPQEPPGAR